MCSKCSTDTLMLLLNNNIILMLHLQHQHEQGGFSGTLDDFTKSKIQSIPLEETVFQKSGGVFPVNAKSAISRSSFSQSTKNYEINKLWLHHV